MSLHAPRVDRNRFSAAHASVGDLTAVFLMTACHYADGHAIPAATLIYGCVLHASHLSLGLVLPSPGQYPILPA